MLSPPLQLHALIFTTFTSAATAFPAAPTLPDRAPSWADLKARTLSTPTGARLAEEAELRSTGFGPPHVNAKLRLFGPNASEEDVRVVLYRDDSAWCPYCQRVWITLEEKQISYICRTVPLNAYGDKPAWFTRLIDGGKLPAIELDGTIVTESMGIMRLLDEAFSAPDHKVQLFPDKDNDPEQMKQMDYLLKLEQKLQSDWFSLVFHPVEGAALGKARDDLLLTLKRVDDALGSTPGPWFFGDDGEAPSIADIMFIATMERVIASCLYWKGLKIRDMGQYPNIDAWLVAFEERQSYRATKADTYSLIKAIPSQNGPGYLTDEAKGIASRICGLDGAWSLPLAYDKSFVEADMTDKEAHRQEAAFVLTDKHEAIVAFAARGAGEAGRPSFHAELADPYAEPNEEFITPVDICLRHVTEALLSGEADDPLSRESVASEDLGGQAGDGTLREYWGEYTDNDGQVYWWNDITGEAIYTPPTKQLDTCLAYLRDRIGVPRDLSPGAAAQLRAHLNWAIGVLNRDAK